MIDPHRLPRTVVPLRYDLRLQPDESLPRWAAGFATSEVTRDGDEWVAIDRKSVV